MVISGLESIFLFITFTNSYLMIGVSEIQLGEALSPAKPIQKLANQKQKILILNN